MSFLPKYCLNKRSIRSGGSRLFSQFLLRKECSNGNFRKLRNCKDFVSSDNIWKFSISRAISTETVLKPVTLTFPTEMTEEFMNFLPKIMRDLTKDEEYSDISEATKRFTDVLNYNLATGSCNIGLGILFSYKMLEKTENLTEENLRLGIVLAWCGELLVTSLVLTDDIMDDSLTRRKIPCWYKLEGIGLTAVNDILFLENSCYIILKKYFSSHPKYVTITEYFHDVFYKTIHGQGVDVLKPKVEEITLDRFKRIVKYKTGYLFSMISVLGLHLSNIYTPELHRNIEPILFQLGLFLQIENDMWDCFGDVNAIGKVATDIQEGKCTWPASIALQKANPVQRQLMLDHYGKPGEKSLEIIRNLYEELDIAGEYAAYKDESYESICKQIREVDMDDTTRTLLLAQALKFCKRKYE